MKDAQLREKLHKRIVALIAKFYNKKPAEKKSLHTTLRGLQKVNFQTAFQMFQNGTADCDLITKEILLTQVLMQAETHGDCIKVARVRGMNQSKLFDIPPRASRDVLLERLPTTECALLVALAMVDEKTSSRPQERVWDNVYEVYMRSPEHSLVVPIVLGDLIAVSYDKKSADKALRKVMGDTKLVKIAFQKLISFLDPTGKTDHSEIANAFRLVGKPEYFDSIENSVSRLPVEYSKVLLETADRPESRSYVARLIACRLSENYQVTDVAGKMTACMDAQECFGILMNSHDDASLKVFVDFLKPKAYFMGCICYKIQEEFIDTITFDLLDYVDQYVSSSAPAKVWLGPKLNELEDELRRNRDIHI